jgi:hypothetical protein
MVGRLGDSVFNRTIYRFKNAIRRERERKLKLGELTVTETHLAKKRKKEHQKTGTAVA